MALGFEALKVCLAFLQLLWLNQTLGYAVVYCCNSSTATNKEREALA